jgi:lipoprotein-anchoring transpeptidase ErfK/SrfK
MDLPVIPRPITRFLHVDRQAKQLTQWRRLPFTNRFVQKASYPIAIGKPGHETTAGLYVILTKAKDPEWLVPDSPWVQPPLKPGQVIPGGDPANPIRARWMGLADGAGIHGTLDLSSLGTAASHGCIRMSEPDVIALYRDTPLGTPVWIA